MRLRAAMLAVMAMATPAHTGDIAIDNFAFTAPAITVPVGTTVTWTNRDDVPHTVVSTDKAFRSPALDTDQTFSHTFDTAGEYFYNDCAWPHITGKIVVQ